MYDNVQGVRRRVYRVYGRVYTECTIVYGRVYAECKQSIYRVYGRVYRVTVECMQSVR